MDKTREFVESLKTNVDAYPHLFDIRKMPGDYKENVENLRKVIDEEYEFFTKEYEED